MADNVHAEADHAGAVISGFWAGPEPHRGLKACEYRAGANAMVVEAVSARMAISASSTPALLVTRWGGAAYGVDALATNTGWGNVAAGDATDLKGSWNDSTTADRRWVADHNFLCDDVLAKSFVSE